MFDMKYNIQQLETELERMDRDFQKNGWPL